MSADDIMPPALTPAPTVTVNPFKRTMSLAHLLQDLQELLPSGLSPDSTHISISGITADSRQVRPGDLFLAIGGEQHHGMDFYQAVADAGARAVLCETSFAGDLSANRRESCPVFPLPDLRQHMALLADRFYDFPSRHLQLIGITGTDGKTSCAHFIAQSIDSLFDDQGNEDQNSDAAHNSVCGVIGTLGYGLYGQPMQDSSHTTPDAVIAAFTCMFYN